MPSARSVVAGVEQGILGVLMIGISALYTINVIVRDVAPNLASRMAWIDEACLFALAWIVFLGLGLGLERGRHIAMTAFLRRTRATLQRRVVFVIDATGLVFSLYIAQLSFELTLMVLRSGQTSPTLGVSMSWLYGPMPVGFALLGWRYALGIAGKSNRLATKSAPEYNV